MNKNRSLMRRIYIVFFIFIFITGFVGLTHAALGARAAGMGGAFVAIGGDLCAMFHNPACLAELKQRQVLVSWQFMQRLNVFKNDDAYCFLSPNFVGYKDFRITLGIGILYDFMSCNYEDEEDYWFELEQIHTGGRRYPIGGGARGAESGGVKDDMFSTSTPTITCTTSLISMAFEPKTTVAAVDLTFGLNLKSKKIEFFDDYNPDAKLYPSPSPDAEQRRARIYNADISVLASFEKYIYPYENLRIGLVIENLLQPTLKTPWFFERYGKWGDGVNFKLNFRPGLAYTFKEPFEKISSMIVAIDGYDVFGLEALCIGVELTFKNVPLQFRVGRYGPTQSMTFGFGWQYRGFKFNFANFDVGKSNACLLELQARF